MNKQNRKTLKEAFGVIENAMEEERDKLFNMEEHFGDTERFQDAQNLLDDFEAAVEELRNALEAYEIDV